MALERGESPKHAFVESAKHAFTTAGGGAFNGFLDCGGSVTVSENFPHLLDFVSEVSCDPGNLLDADGNLTFPNQDRISISFGYEPRYLGGSIPPPDCVATLPGLRLWQGDTLSPSAEIIVAAAVHDPNSDNYVWHDAGKTIAYQSSGNFFRIVFQANTQPFDLTPGATIFAEMPGTTNWPRSDEQTEQTNTPPLGAGVLSVPLPQPKVDPFLVVGQFDLRKNNDTPAGDLFRIGDGASLGPTDQMAFPININGDRITIKDAGSFVFNSTTIDSLYATDYLGRNWYKMTAHDGQTGCSGVICFDPIYRLDQLLGPGGVDTYTLAANPTEPGAFNYTWFYISTAEPVDDPGTIRASSGSLGNPGDAPWQMIDDVGQFADEALTAGTPLSRQLGVDVLYQGPLPAPAFRAAPASPTFTFNYWRTTGNTTIVDGLPSWITSVDYELLPAQPQFQKGRITIEFDPQAGDEGTYIFNLLMQEQELGSGRRDLRVTKTVVIT